MRRRVNWPKKRRDKRAKRRQVSPRLLRVLYPPTYRHENPNPAPPGLLPDDWLRKVK
jgi:hypothetical protein